MPAPSKFVKTVGPPRDAVDRTYRWSLHGLLFLSGGIALVYEVLWLRRFTAVFGATTPATAATLAAVFVGLTAGSAFLGARSARFSRPLRAYALLEAGAGLAALLVGPLLMVYDRLYPALYSSLSGSVVVFAALKLLLTTVALFLPAFCMGGTVPVLAQALATTGGRVGLVGSGLYAANTLGAAAGALSVPFFWLPQFGATMSYGVCVVLNLVLGALAWTLDRRSRASGAFSRMDDETPRGQTPPKTTVPFPTWALTALAGLSGGLTFILEVTWARMFAQVHENSLYSFAVVVAVFILGLGSGAAVTRAGLSRGWEAKRLLGLIWTAGGVAVFASPYCFLSLTNDLSSVPQPGGWAAYGWRLLWLATATFFLPTLLAGMVLPLLMELAGGADGRRAGKVLGRLLATNTAGVVIGSLLAAFVLPKWVGLWTTIAGAGILMVVAGEVCCGRLCSPDLLTRPWDRIHLPQQSVSYPTVWSVRRLVACGLIVASVVWWNPAKLPRAKVRASAGEQLISLTEGNHGIVAVVEQPGSRRLKLDNFYTLGGTASTGDERMQAHVPLLLHPAPKRVAFLGLGTGITAGAALLHPVERVTAIEIVPEVVSAAKEHFGEANLGIVGSPRAEIVVEDARDFLRGSGRKFDVIVGDLVVPWRRGEAALYSAENFGAVRRALAPGGIFCQWLPMFQLSEDEFRIVAATFLDVFPQATLWRGDFAPEAPALALIGHADEAALIDAAVVAQRVHELKRDDSNLHLAHEAGLWMFLVGAMDPMSPQFASARRNREDRPWLEILAPLAHAAASGGNRPVFTGRALERWLDESRTRGLAGSLLQTLPAAQRQWREAGGQLAESSLLLSEGKRAEADSRLRRAAAALPPEIQRVFVPDFSAPDGVR